MAREPAAYISAAAIAIALVALAFVVAPRACAGGLEVYFWCGVAAVLLLALVPFITHNARMILVRCALAFGFALFGAAAWIAGMLAANVRFICGMGYF